MVASTIVLDKFLMNDNRGEVVEVEERNVEEYDGDGEKGKKSRILSAIFIAVIIIIVLTILHPFSSSSDTCFSLLFSFFFHCLF